MISNESELFDEDYANPKPAGENLNLEDIGLCVDFYASSAIYHARVLGMYDSSVRGYEIDKSEYSVISQTPTLCSPSPDDHRSL